MCLIILGVVLDEDQKPIEGARIIVKNLNHTVVSTGRGEFWRLLVPGKYEVAADARGYRPSDPKVVNVESDKPTIVNFTLYRKPDDGK